MLHTNWTPRARGHVAEHNEISKRLINLMDYIGYVDGSDWSLAINQSAADASSEGRELVIPPGTYSIYTPVTLACSVKASPDAIFRAKTVSAYVQIGSGIDRLSTARLVLPQLYNDAEKWYDTGIIGDDIGYRLIGIYSCKLSFSLVTGFSRGISWETGVDATLFSQENQIDLGHVTNCAIGFCVRPTGAWISENYIVSNGVVGNSASLSTRISGTRGLELLKPTNPDYDSGANLFAWGSLEGDYYEYQIYCNQANNIFLKTRFENDNGPRIFWGSDSMGNWIIGGTSAWDISVTDNGIGNIILTYNRTTDGSLALYGANVEIKDGNGMILSSPDGNRWKIIVDNSGIISGSSL